jgi:hypothetical protein
MIHTFLIVRVRLALSLHLFDRLKEGEISTRFTISNVFFSLSLSIVLFLHAFNANLLSSQRLKINLTKIEKVAKKRLKNNQHVYWRNKTNKKYHENQRIGEKAPTCFSVVSFYFCHSENSLIKYS